MRVDRELRGAGPDAQHAQPDDVAVERTNGLRGRPFQAGRVHGGNERLAQFDTGVACPRELSGLRTAHQGHDGVERSVADQLLDHRLADRTRRTENHRRVPARHRENVPRPNDRSRQALAEVRPFWVKSPHASAPAVLHRSPVDESSAGRLFERGQSGQPGFGRRKCGQKHVRRGIDRHVDRLRDDERRGKRRRHPRLERHDRHRRLRCGRAGRNVQSGGAVLRRRGEFVCVHREHRKYAKRKHGFEQRNVHGPELSVHFLVLRRRQQPCVGSRRFTRRTTL